MARLTCSGCGWMSDIFYSDEYGESFCRSCCVITPKKRSTIPKETNKNER